MLLVVSLAAGGNPSCERDAKTDPARSALTASELTTEECAVCGMVVVEQPAPRVQVVHRDGARKFTCSVGDAVHHLADSSRHGAARAVFVEVLDPAADPTVTDPSKRPWRNVAQLSFVVGVKRSGVMGPPVLAYESREAAQTVAAQYGGTVQSWDEVRESVLAAKGGSPQAHRP